MHFTICKQEMSFNDFLNDEVVLCGYKLPSRNKNFIIGDELVTNLIITNKKLAHPFVSRAAFKKYNRLLEELTELFVEEGDSSSGMNEILNKIERFREEIKRKYRKYLKRKELEEMAKSLKMLKKQASEQQLLIYYNKEMNVFNEEKTTGKSR